MIIGAHSIIYSKDADWTMMVEGKKYYAIMNEDVLAKIEP